MAEAKTKCIVNLAEALVVEALTMAAVSRKRYYNTNVAKYGPDHILMQTMAQEASDFELAAKTVTKG